MERATSSAHCRREANSACSLRVASRSRGGVHPDHQFALPAHIQKETGGGVYQQRAAPACSQKEEQVGTLDQQIVHLAHIQEEGEGGALASIASRGYHRRQLMPTEGRGGENDIRGEGWGG